MRAVDRGAGRRNHPAVAVALCGLLGACGGSGPGAGPAAAPPAVVTKAVALDAAQSVPIVESAGSGAGTLTFNLQTGEVGGTITTTGVRVPRMFLQEGAVGTNGAQVLEIFPDFQSPPGPDNRYTWRVFPNTLLAPAQVESLKAGNLYVSVTSPDHGAEIRGQVGRRVFFAPMDGAQQVPAVATGASGAARFVLDTDTRALSGDVGTTNIAGTAAELRSGAAGANGPIVVSLVGGPASWTVPAGTVLDADQADALVHGRVHVSVHSEAYPGGEIRGQVAAPVRTAAMSGEQEVPPVATGATGTCSMFVDPVVRSATALLATTIQGAAAAHIHPAANAATTVIDLRPEAGVWTATAFPLDDAMLLGFMKGELFCDVHTAEHPNGEIRGTLASAP